MTDRCSSDIAAGLPSDAFVTRAQLRALLGGTDPPLVLDVRRDAAFAASRWMLPRAVRCAPESLVDWMTHRRTPCPAVAYCVHGHQVSQGVAATLRTAGWTAWVLAGGIEGDVDAAAPDASSQLVAQWRRAGLHLQAKAAP